MPYTNTNKKKPFSTKTLLVVVIVMIAVVGAFVSAAFAIRGTAKDVVAKTQPTLTLSMSEEEEDDVVLYYPGVSIPLVANLRFSDGSLNDNVEFDYEYDPNLIVFDRNSGTFTIKPDLKLDESIETTITIKCVTDEYSIAPITRVIKIDKAPEYTITLNYNGGTQGVDHLDAWPGKQVKGLPTPSLNEHYTFDGWYVWSNATQAVDVNYKFNPQENYEYDADITLIARYSAPLALNDDMGERIDLGVLDNKIYYNEPLPVDLPVLEKKRGWTFSGWFTGVAGAGEEYSGVSDVFDEETPVLFAKWGATVTTNAVFDTKNGIAASYGLVYHGLFDLPSPEYKNYGRFINWFAQDGTTEKEVKLGDRYDLNANVALYAKVAFPVEFDYQGATEKLLNQGKTYYVVYQDSQKAMQSYISVPLDQSEWYLPSPKSDVEDGWHFDGWYTQPGGQGTYFSTTTKYTEEKPLKLYAKRSSHFYLYYELSQRGDAVAAAEKEALPVIYNQDITIPAISYTPEDWTFEGWYTACGGADSMARPATDKLALTGRIGTLENYVGHGNVDLYAKWNTQVKLFRHTIKNSQHELFDTVTLTYNASVGELPRVPYESGVTFGGWFDRTNGDGAELNDSVVYNHSLPVFGSLELFEKLFVPITLEYNDGGVTSNKTIQAVYGKSLDDAYASFLLPSEKQLLPTPSFAGEESSKWAFSGWWTTFSDTKFSVDNGDVCAFDAPFTVTAKWLSDFTLFYEINLDGTAAESEEGLASYVWTVEYNAPLSLPNQKADSWNFAGWWTAEGDQGVVQANSAEGETYVGAPAKRLYAHWTCELKFYNHNDRELSKIGAGDVTVVYSPVTVTYKGIVGTLPTLSYNKSLKAESAGWFDEQYGQGNALVVGASYTLVTSHVFYEKLFVTATLNYNDSVSETKEIRFVYGLSLDQQDDDANMLSDPTHKGNADWNFAGWYDNASFDNATVCEKDSTFTLTARWLTDLKLMLELDGSGEPSDGTFVMLPNVAYNEPIDFPASPKAGDWTFAGWYNRRGGVEGAQKLNETNYAYVGDPNAEVYAVWFGYITVNPQLTLKSQVSVPKELMVTYQAPIDMRSIDDLDASIYGNEDASFAGWYFTNDGSGDSIQSGYIYKQGLSATIYARVDFRLSINYQEATNTNGGVESYTVTYRAPIGELPSPTKRGWSFNGYYDNEGCSGALYTPSTIYDFVGNKTIYAGWSVEFRFYDENISDDPQAGATITTGLVWTEYYKRDIELPQLQAKGSWLFAGWYTAAHGVGTIIESINSYLEWVEGASDPELTTDSGKPYLILYAKRTASVSLNYWTDEENIYSDLREIEGIIYGQPISAILNVGLPNNTSAKRDPWNNTGRWYSSTTYQTQILWSSTYQYPKEFDWLHLKWDVSQGSIKLDPKDGTEQLIAKEPFYGEPMPSASLPTREGCTFMGYYDLPQKTLGEIPEGAKQYYAPPISGNDLISTSLWDKVTDSVVYLYGYWTENRVIIWCDERETVYQQVTANDGQTVEFNGNVKDLTWAETPEFKYEFKGWYLLADENRTLIEQASFSATVSGNAVYIAYNEATRKSYTVTWQNDDGSTLKEEQVPYGKFPVAPTASKAMTVSTVYTFNRWDPVPASVVGDATYTATYNSAVRKYQIRFIDENGKVLQESEVAYNTMPEYSGATPIKEATTKYSYKYNGKWKDDNSDSVGITLVTEAKTYRVVFDATVREYKITWYNYNNKSIGEKYVKYGDVPTYDFSTPTKPKDNEWIYSFSGWSPTVVAVTGATNYTAQFKATKRMYTVTLAVNDSTYGQLGSSGTLDIAYGTAISSSGRSVTIGNTTIYATPTEANSKYTYSFVDWTNGNTTVKSNITVKANFKRENTFHKLNVTTLSEASIKINGTGIGQGGEYSARYGETVKINVSYNKNDHKEFRIGDENYDGKTEITYTMPDYDVNISVKSWNCITTGSLITLADGSRVPVEQLTGSEMLLVWNLFTGTYDVAPILFIDFDETDNYEIINLVFSDGTTVKVISEHGFYDVNMNRYVFLRADAARYIGHWFIKEATEGDLESVQLVDVYLTTERTESWSPVTYGHLCYFVDGMLSMPGNTESFINIFYVDPEKMQIDEDGMEADIAQYGLFEYSDFADILPEEIFYAFGGPYLKVAMAKGIVSWEAINALVSRYEPFWAALMGEA